MSRFDSQFREDDDEREERWRRTKAKRIAEGKCWQCACLIAECRCWSKEVAKP
jgi:hypothetical protein